MRRRPLLVGLAVSLAGCASSGDGETTATTTEPTTAETTEPPTTTTTETPTATTTTATPVPEFSRMNFRRVILSRIDDARAKYGMESLRRDEALTEFSQEIAATRNSGSHVENERDRLEELGCPEGDVILANGLFETTINAADGEGLTKLETPEDYADYILETWLEPSRERQSILESTYTRVGIGHVYTDDDRAYTAVTFCR